MSSEAKKDNAIVIGSSTDTSSSLYSLQPKATKTTPTNGNTSNVISDEMYNYGAPSWSSMDGPSTISDTEKAARKGSANVWQERVPGPSNGEEGEQDTDYVYVRNKQDGEVVFDSEFGLLGKTDGTKSNGDATGTSGPAWTRNNAWSSIATYR
jgi:hypothetical protein